MPSLSLTPTPLKDALLQSHLDSAEVADRLRNMRVQEEEPTYRVRDYLAESAEIRNLAKNPADADCRGKMCEWFYQVVDFCEFHRETVGIGMSYLDRDLSTAAGRSALCNRNEYQLAAMTVLYVAIKRHVPLEMETSLLAYLRSGCYNETQFSDMEQRVLKSLQWRVSCPTLLTFVQYFLTFLPSTVHRCMAFLPTRGTQIELATVNQSFATVRPSQLN